MTELRVLGASELHDPSGSKLRRIELPPKRFALLSYLALARPRPFQRRDVLCTMFWPESNHTGARNALSQAIHTIREAIGGDLVISRGREEIGLANNELICDALEFERRLAADELSGALELYKGSLLPGLFARGAAGFERWVEGERARLRRQARDAASRLAVVEEEAGNAVAAIRWLERALEIIPTDETIVRRLIGALHDAGDRGGALAAFDRFSRFMEAEYEATPSAETSRLVALVKRSATVPAEPVRSGPPFETSVRSIAVLPLLALSPDEGGLYSAEGMTEALVMELGRIRSLRVISHQSVRQFRDSRLPLNQIARILGVEALVEGSVLEAGGRVRVTAQLVRAEPEQHLWADAFERDARDVISVHRDLAHAIATAVTTALTADEEHQLTSEQPVHPAAYHACLQGWMKHTTLVPAEMARALPMYLEAIALDPDFALARANLAVLLFNLIIVGELPVEPHLENMREAAGIAMRLDPSLALAHVGQGAERLFAHDWTGTEECLRRALAMNPNLPVGQAIRTVFLTGMARFEEGLDAAERARHLDPLAPYANWLRGWSLHYARRPEESIREQDRVLDLFDDYPLARIFTAKCYYQLGDRARTIEACRRSLELLPENPMTLSYVAHMLCRLGNRAEATRVYETLENQRTTRQFVPPYYAAVALCGLDRIDDALDELDRISPDASTTGVLLGVDPLLDPLRGEARFDAVLKRVSLASLAGDSVRRRLLIR